MKHPAVFVHFKAGFHIQHEFPIALKLQNINTKRNKYTNMCTYSIYLKGFLQQKGVAYIKRSFFSHVHQYRSKHHEREVIIANHGKCIARFHTHTVIGCNSSQPISCHTWSWYTRLKDCNVHNTRMSLLPFVPCVEEVSTQIPMPWDSFLYFMDRLAKHDLRDTIHIYLTHSRARICRGKQTGG